MAKKKRNVMCLAMFFGILIINFVMVLQLAKPDPKIVTKVVKQEETVIVLRNPGPLADFTQSNEGTVVVNLRATDKDVNIGENPPTKIQLFKSNTVKGVVLYYLYGDKIITGGTPRLITPEVNLLDGNMHEIVYTFKTGERQTLYFDKQKIAESVYEPLSLNSVTGYIIRGRIANSIGIDSTSDTEIKLYDKQLTEDDMKAMI